MTNQSIKAVLLDYGGVIADEGFQNGIRALAREQGLDEQATLKKSADVVYESGFVLGCGSEDDFWQGMREHTGLDGDRSDMTRRLLQGFVLRPWMLEWARRLKSRDLIVGILSDQAHWLDWLDQRDDFFREFDHVFNSYYLGKGKRHQELFGELVNLLELSPAEILLVDDLDGNVERAQMAGWRTIRYRDQADFLRTAEDFFPGSTARLA